MSQDVMDRPTPTHSAAPANEELLDRLATIHERNRERELRQTADQLEALRESVAAELRQVFPRELRETIRSQVTRDGDPRGPGLRYRSLVAARDSGVDLERLKKVQADARRRFFEIVRGDTAYTIHENVVGSVRDLLKEPPILFFPPDPDKEKLFYPSYGGCWDRIEQGWATGDGVVTENFSYLDCTARLGARLSAHNHDAADIDEICVYREGGYLVPFTTLKTGILQVKADLSALFCQHHISTDDEWGWSEFNAETRGRLILAVFWNWEDIDPANEVSHSWFTGLGAGGDGESFPGTSVQAIPGERRIVNLFTTMAFAAGQKLWVYVGLSNRLYAHLNDVGIDMSIDSAWWLNSLAIRSI